MILFCAFLITVGGCRACAALLMVGKDEVCMEELGCFFRGGDFYHPIYRPINLLPNDREVINTTFLLYTRANSKIPQYLRSSKKDSVLNSNFDATKPTKLITHGFLDNQFFGNWMKEMTSEFLIHGDYNVIIVDWSRGNMLPYTQATANTRVAGAEIALLLSRLQEWVGINGDDIHILGHSLGAHVAGYSGKKFRGIGRITALDPAEPYFQYMPPSVRVDRTDAKFVDVIHTDSVSILFMGLGMAQSVGHVDFFPNDGKSQPGCIASKITSFITDGLVEGARRFIACNHQRAVDFFTSSINHPECVQVGYACPSWEAYTNGKCTECGLNHERCGVMGLRADKYPPSANITESVVLYLATNSKEPFCEFQYRVDVTLHKASNGQDEKGTLKVALFGDYGNGDFDLSKSAEDLYLGSRYSYMIRTDSELGPIRNVDFQWSYSSSIYNPLTWIRKPRLFLTKITIVPLNIIDNEVKQRETKHFCTSNKEDPIYSGKTVSLKPC